MVFQGKKIRLLLSDFDIGAGKKGAARGPLALFGELKALGLDLGRAQKLDGHTQSVHSDDFPFCRHIEEITDAAILLQENVKSALENSELPLVFSGDHSNAIGGLSGLKCTYPGKRIGVIWIDAHADLHSPYTTPSGNLHGMPLAALSSCDNLARARNPVSENESLAWQKLKSIGGREISPKVQPSDIVFIGLRDAEKEEWSLIDEHQILYFEPEYIREHGIYAVINKTQAKLKDCDLIYVSFDADSLDPSISVGTGTPVENGLKLSEARALIHSLLRLPNLGVFEVTEINPGLDRGAMPMAEVMASLLRDGLQES